MGQRLKDHIPVFELTQSLGLFSDAAAPKARNAGTPIVANPGGPPARDPSAPKWLTHPDAHVPAQIRLLPK